MQTIGRMNSLTAQGRNSSKINDTGNNYSDSVIINGSRERGPSIVQLHIRDIHRANNHYKTNCTNVNQHLLDIKKFLTRLKPTDDMSQFIVGLISELDTHFLTPLDLLESNIDDAQENFDYSICAPLSWLDVFKTDLARCSLSDNIRKEAEDLIIDVENGVLQCEETVKKRQSIFKSARHLHGFTESLEQSRGQVGKGKGDETDITTGFIPGVRENISVATAQHSVQPTQTPSDKASHPSQTGKKSSNMATCICNLFDSAGDTNNDPNLTQRQDDKTNDAQGVEGQVRPAMQTPIHPLGVEGTVRPAKVTPIHPPLEQTKSRHQKRRTAGKISRAKHKTSKHSRANMNRGKGQKGGSRLFFTKAASLGDAGPNTRTCLLNSIIQLLPTKTNSESVKKAITTRMPREGDTSIENVSGVLKDHGMRLYQTTAKYKKKGGLAYNLLQEQDCKLVLKIKLIDAEKQVANHFVAWDGKIIHDHPYSSKVNRSSDRRNSDGSNKVFDKLFKNEIDNFHWQITNVFCLEFDGVQLTHD